eukprot:15079267-Alexandrium_andersonii.AAC.1
MAQSLRSASLAVKTLRFSAVPSSLRRCTACSGTLGSFRVKPERCPELPESACTCPQLTKSARS